MQRAQASRDLRGERMGPGPTRDHRRCGLSPVAEPGPRPLHFSRLQWKAKPAAGGSAAASSRSCRPGDREVTDRRRRSGPGTADGGQNVYPAHSQLSAAGTGVPYASLPRVSPASGVLGPFGGTGAGAGARTQVTRSRGPPPAARGWKDHGAAPGAGAGKVGITRFSTAGSVLDSFL